MVMNVFMNACRMHCYECYVCYYSRNLHWISGSHEVQMACVSLYNLQANIASTVEFPFSISPWDCGCLGHPLMIVISPGQSSTSFWTITLTNSLPLSDCKISKNFYLQIVSNFFCTLVYQWKQHMHLRLVIHIMPYPVIWTIRTVPHIYQIYL